MQGMEPTLVHGETDMPLMERTLVQGIGADVPLMEGTLLKLPARQGSGLGREVCSLGISLDPRHLVCGGEDEEKTDDPYKSSSVIKSSSDDRYIVIR